MRLTGLSRATIDRVLNEREGVHTRTQAIVDAALRQLRETSNASFHAHREDRRKHYKAIIQVGDAFTQSIVDEADRLAPSLAARNCTLEVLPCVGIPSKRVAGLIAAQSDADGLIIIAKNSAEIVDAAALFREQGKAIVTSHTDLDLAARHAYVGIDNRAAGQTVGFLMGRHMPADTPANLELSDKICTALQLINFWQDVEVDWRKYRIYIPLADMERFGVTEGIIAAGEVTPQFSALMDFEIQRARTMMLQGAPLARKLPGRIGWELRLVVQGGLAILDKIEGVGYDVFTRRPALGKTDWLRLIWRAATR